MKARAMQGGARSQARRLLRRPGIWSHTAVYVAIGVVVFTGLVVAWGVGLEVALPGRPRRTA